MTLFHANITVKSCNNGLGVGKLQKPGVKHLLAKEFWNKSSIAILVTITILIFGKIVQLASTPFCTASMQTEFPNGKHGEWVMGGLIYAQILRASTIMSPLSSLRFLPILYSLPLEFSNIILIIAPPPGVEKVLNKIAPFSA